MKFIPIFYLVQWFLSLYEIAIFKAELCGTACRGGGTKIGRVRIHTCRIFKQIFSKKAGEKLFFIIQRHIQTPGWFGKHKRWRRTDSPEIRSAKTAEKTATGHGTLMGNWSPTSFPVQRYTVLFNGHFSLKYLYCFIFSWTVPMTLFGAAYAKQSL